MSREENIKLLCEHNPKISIDKITQIYDDSFDATRISDKAYGQRKAQKRILESKSAMKLRNDFAFSRTNVILSFDKTDSMSDMFLLQYMKAQLKEMKERWGFDK